MARVRTSAAIVLSITGYRSSAMRQSALCRLLLFSVAFHCENILLPLDNWLLGSFPEYSQVGFLLIDSAAALAGYVNCRQKLSGKVVSQSDRTLVKL